jgi:sigma-B regulation protein RsbU (phosphoserine phosphatase)
MRAVSEFVSSPAEILARVDSTLKDQRPRSICTAMCVRLEQSRATLAVGGHPLPLYITPGEVSEVGEYGPLLGGFPDVHWDDVALELAPNSTLVAYTDGVTDAIGADGMRYGLARLRQTLAECCQWRSADDVIQGLTDALGEFQVGAHADDTAVLVIRRRSPVALAPQQETAEVDRTDAVAASP